MMLDNGLDVLGDWSSWVSGGGGSRRHVARMACWQGEDCGATAPSASVHITIPSANHRVEGGWSTLFTRATQHLH